MKRATIFPCSIAIAVALLGGIAETYANTDDVYHDLVRPNGQPRDDATFQADLNFCYGQTGASRYQQDTSAFKQCMLGRKWQWTSVRKSGTAKSSSKVVTYNRDSKNPNVGWHTQGGMRVCTQDCDNPEIPGSGYTCRNVNVLGMAMRECTSSN
jgi:hypothetical protein